MILLILRLVGGAYLAAAPLLSRSQMNDCKIFELLNKKDVLEIDDKYKRVKRDTLEFLETLDYHNITHQLLDPRPYHIAGFQTDKVLVNQEASGVLREIRFHLTIAVTSDT